MKDSSKINTVVGQSLRLSATYRSLGITNYDETCKFDIAVYGPSEEIGSFSLEPVVRIKPDGDIFLDHEDDTFHNGVIIGSIGMLSVLTGKDWRRELIDIAEKLKDNPKKPIVIKKYALPL